MPVLNSGFESEPRKLIAILSLPRSGTMLNKTADLLEPFPDRKKEPPKEKSQNVIVQPIPLLLRVG